MVSTSCREIASPSPVPPKRLVVEASTWENGWKMCCWWEGEMPIPVSETSNARSTASSEAAAGCTDRTTSPVSVNLIALAVRFSSTCRSRDGSPRSGVESPGQRVMSSIPLA